MTGVGDPPLGNPVTPDIHAMTTGIGLDSVALGPNLMTTDTGVIADMTTTGTAPVPSTDLPIVAPHVTGAPVHIATAETLPTADLLLTTTPPGIIAGPDIAPDNANTNQPEDQQQQHRHHLKNMKTRNKDITKSQLMTNHQNITAQMKVKPTLKMILTRCTLCQNMLMERAIQ